MTTDFPEDLRSLDARLAQTFAADAPPPDLAARVQKSLRAQSRLRLSPGALRPVLKPAAAAAAVALLAAAGYVAESRINPRPAQYATGDVVASLSAPRSLAFKGQGDVAADADGDGQISMYFNDSMIEKARNEAAASSPAPAARPAEGKLGEESSLRRSTALAFDAPTDKLKNAPSRQLWADDADVSRDREGGDKKQNAKKESAARFQPASVARSSGERSKFADGHVNLELSDAGPGGAFGGGGGGGGGMNGGRFAAALQDAKDAPAAAAPAGAADAPVAPALPVGAAPVAPPPAVEPVVFTRRVIRSGTVAFQVDSFDSALLTVTKLVLEDGGFVAGTESAKLPNGKTRGVVTVRLPPDRLDALVLKLRGLGDLKSQQITSQDVSKAYADNDSALRAARAMEERLLEIIKTSKGAIKDLLAAEKELGVWRGKIEEAEGQKRYYDNLIGLSTLAIALEERDIKAAAGSIESETVDAGVETPEVEWARGQLLEAIESAKGRVVASDLKKLDAGQLAANVTAEVPPEAAGAIIDRLRQFGSVARLDAQRKTTAVDGTSPPTPGAQVTKRPTTLRVSLYNLANVAPRLTQTTTLAAADVEKAYAGLLVGVEQAGGRVVRSGLTRPQPDTTNATLELEAPSGKAAAVAALLAGSGETMSLQLTENPDTANVTTAKQGFVVRLVAAAGVAPRETTTLQLAAADVSGARDALSRLVEQAGGRMLATGLQQSDANRTSADLTFDVPRAAEAELKKMLAATGDFVSRQVSRSSDTQQTLDSKLRYVVTLLPAGNLPPKMTTTATVLLAAPERDAVTIADAATRAGGRVLDRQVNRAAGGRQSARLALDVPRDKAETILAALRDAGDVNALSTSTSAQAPDGPLARARFDITFAEPTGISPTDAGVWSSVRNGITTSLRGLAWSLQLIIIGVCLVLPWALLLWLGTKLYRRVRAKAA